MNQTTRSYCQNRTMDDVKKCSLYSLIFEINEVYAVLKQNYGNYDLSEVELLGIQNSLLSGRYHFSPLRLVIEYGASPRSNSTPTFSVEPSNTADQVVIGALGAILIKELGRTSFFKGVCYSTYKEDGFNSLSHYLSTIQEWREVDALLRLNCSNSAITFPRSRLIEKVKTIIHSEQLVHLIISFCNLPIVDNMDRVISVKTCFPPMIFIGEILLNIILSDIDHEMEKRFPKLARLQHEILIPIFGKDNDGMYNTALDEIFNQSYFMAPVIERAVRGGEPIPFSGGFIHINEDGQILIQSDC